jgi:hypothetical protein
LLPDPGVVFAIVDYDNTDTEVYRFWFAAEVATLTWPDPHAPPVWQGLQIGHGDDWWTPDELQDYGYGGFLVRFYGRPFAPGTVWRVVSPADLIIADGKPLSITQSGTVEEPS